MQIRWKKPNGKKPKRQRKLYAHVLWTPGSRIQKIFALRKRGTPFLLRSEQKGVSKAEEGERERRGGETATMRRADPKLERPRGI